MKKLLSLAIMLIWNQLIIGQYIVIDTTYLGGMSIPFQDTLISSIDPDMGSCISTDYFLDLDQDDNSDVKFHLECHMGGMGSSYKIYISTLNSYSIHVDTNYQEYYQYLVEGVGAVDTVRTVTVVKKYNWGDTIFSDQNSLSTGDYLLRYSFGNYPPCIYNKIDLFLYDTSYIAFTKNDGNTPSIYYLKIYVKNYSKVALISAKTNAQPNYVDEKELLSNHVFPNPVAEEIFFKGEYNLAEIYTMQGTLILKENISTTENSIDVSELQGGFYIILLKNNNKKLLDTFIKL